MSKRIQNIIIVLKKLKPIFDTDKIVKGAVEFLLIAQVGTGYLQFLYSNT